MRPRFSLRWILVSFVFFGVLLYVVFARPTVMANRLANDFKRGDFSALDNVEFWASYARPTTSITSVMQSLEAWADKGRPIEVSVEPRTWEDIWLWRRRLKLLAGYEVIDIIPLGKQFTDLQNVKERRIYKTTFEIETGVLGPRLINQTSLITGSNQ
jgi:hypothetical protein